jgi:hypothetical protein
MIDMETIDQHGVLGGDHVVIGLVREAHAQTVGGLARFAVADVVGQDDVELRNIERLTGPEENVGKGGVEQGMGVTTCAVEKQDGVVGVSGRIAVRLAQREVVEFQLRN